ncbi:MAG: alpha/beta hydrolase [Myxococcales bacterium]|nr:alpha/beta hydrolase [Myxococcales bacterium]
MQRIIWAISGAGLLVFLASSAWLAKLDERGPVGADVELDGGLSASFYLPGAQPTSRVRVAPLFGEPRPPGVVLMHGFSMDRRSMSSLARALAGAGYAVLSIDAAGHGDNRAPFHRGWGRADAHADVFGRAVDFLRASPHVDGGRIAVGGHSMGASAALDYATRDSGLDATLLISGGYRLEGPYRPPNVLVLVAEADPPDTARGLAEIAAGLADGSALPPGETSGDPALGLAVRHVVVAETDHVDVIFATETAGEIVSWLDASFGIERSTPLALADARLPVLGFAMLGALLALPGLGLLVGRLVPARAALPAAGPAALAGLALALVGVLPVLMVGEPLAFLSLEVGDVILSWLSLAGVALLVVLALRGQLAGLGGEISPVRTLLGAGLGFLVMTLFMQPLHEVAHGMSLSAGRAGVFAAAALVVLPFALAYQLLLRRGSPLRAAVSGALGVVVVLVVMGAATSLGVLSPVVMLMLGVIGLAFVALEVFAAGVYAQSRNTLVIAAVAALWLAWITALAVPLRL